MKRYFFPVLLILCLTTLGYGSIIKITVNAPIHPITSEYILKSLEKADRENASLIIISLNTPGGLDTSMREIIEKILSTKTPVVAFVSPSGARAASAGFFIGVACDLFVMAPGTNTGAAHPVGISITGQQMDETMADKVTHDAASYIKSISEKRGRNAKMAEDAVRESLSYTEKEALEGGLIDLIAKDEQEIIDFFHNKTIQKFDGEEIILDLQDEEIVDLPMTARQKFLLTISNPNLAYILLMLGLLGLYFEFSNPGAILPGVLGGLCLLVAIFSFQILPINYVGLILILLSIGLFILELKIQSYGILSVGGVLAMVIGSIMLIDAPIPELRPSLMFIIPVALGLSLIFLFLIILAVRVHMRKALTGKEGLVGKIGVARTDLNPEGKVFVHGEIWNAEAQQDIPQGAKVKVSEVLENLKINVTKV
ncbi:MAG: nodulation protein NfeD [Candidatus Aminicenantes bacterium]|nr:nodulation protein NfeD [Candidatus Aminicenantes bacterium]